MTPEPKGTPGAGKKTGSPRKRTPGAGEKTGGPRTASDRPSPRKRKDRVLMLLSNPFRPDPRVHKEAGALAEAGYRVKILAWSREGGFLKEQSVDGIRVERFGLRSGYGRPLIFALTLPLFWTWLFFKTLSSDAGVVHCHDLDTLPPGYIAGRLSGKRVIFDAHELYPEMIRGAAPGIAVAAAGWLERFIVPRTDLVIVVNERFEEIYGKMGAGEVAVVMNCNRDGAKTGETPEWAKNAEHPVLLYIGVLEPTRMVLEGIEAVSSQQGSMVVGGFGSLQTEVESSCSRHPNAKFIGRVKPSELPAHNASADALFAVYDPSNANNANSTPNKLFEAMAAGKPVIIAKGTHAAGVVGKEACGWTIGYGDGEALAGILKSLQEDPERGRVLGANGRRAFEREYNWPAMAKRLLEAYGQLAAKGT